MQQEYQSYNLRYQLNDTTGLGNLLLRELADVAGTDDDGDLGEAALAEDLGVAEGKEIENGRGVLLLASEVGLTGLGGDEGPELESTVSTHCILRIIFCASSGFLCLTRSFSRAVSSRVESGGNYLVDVYRGAPEVSLETVRS